MPNRELAAASVQRAQCLADTSELPSLGLLPMPPWEGQQGQAPSVDLSSGVASAAAGACQCRDEVLVTVDDARSRTQASQHSLCLYVQVGSPCLPAVPAVHALPAVLDLPAVLGQLGQPPKAARPGTRCLLASVQVCLPVSVQVCLTAEQVLVTTAMCQLWVPPIMKLTSQLPESAGWYCSQRCVKLLVVEPVRVRAGLVC